MMHLNMPALFGSNFLFGEPTMIYYILASPAGHVADDQGVVATSN